MRKPATVIEKLPSIESRDLGSRRGNYSIDLAFKLPAIASAKLGHSGVTFFHKSLHRGQLGDQQFFSFRRIPTRFGYRTLFQCNCGKSVKALYFHHGRLACRWCCGAIYASQTSSKTQRPVLQLSRLESLLGDKGYSR